VEFRVDLVGVSVAGTNSCSYEAELVEDVYGLLPDVACGVAVTGGVVRIAEVVQIGSERVLVAELPLDGDGSLEVLDGLLILTEEMVSVAEAGLRLARYFSTSERFWLNLQGR